MLLHPRAASTGSGRGERIRALIERLEREQPADLTRDAGLLKGVWELRRSSSHLPYLAVDPGW